MPLKTVLVIEDQEEIREGLRDVLEAEGYIVLTAGNGKEGLALVRDHDQPCVIILDIQMPVMNGWEFIEAFGISDPAARAKSSIIIISAFSEAAARAKINAENYFKKPVNLSALLEAIKTYSA